MTQSAAKMATTVRPAGGTSDDQESGGSDDDTVHGEDGGDIVWLADTFDRLSDLTHERTMRLSQSLMKL